MEEKNKMLSNVYKCMSKEKTKWIDCVLKAFALVKTDCMCLRPCILQTLTRLRFILRKPDALAFAHEQCTCTLATATNYKLSHNIHRLPYLIRISMHTNADQTVSRVPACVMPNVSICQLCQPAIAFRSDVAFSISIRFIWRFVHRVHCWTHPQSAHKAYDIFMRI